MNRGVTLTELVVSLLVLGLLMALVGIGLGSLRRPPTEAWRTDVTRARDSAIRTGQRVTMRGDSGYRVLLLPDGRAIGRGLDPLTGAVTGVDR